MIFGQFFNGISEAEMLIIHQEADGGSVRAAAKAMIELLVRADHKGGCFFVVERTAALVFAAGFLELYTRIDEIDDVAACDKLIYEFSRDAAAHLQSATVMLEGKSSPGVML